MVTVISSNGVQTVTYMGTNEPVTNTVTTYSTNVIDCTNIINLDTVLGVYQGSSSNPKYLNQVAANDDMFPVNVTLGSSGALESPLADDFANGGITFPGAGITKIVTGISGFETGIAESGEFEFIPPYYGSSHLKFNAVGGQTYYFAVDTKAGTTGGLVFNWAYKSSGVFRFASEDVDWVTGLPL